MKVNVFDMRLETCINVKISLLPSERANNNRY